MWTVVSSRARTAVGRYRLRKFSAPRPSLVFAASLFGNLAVIVGEPE
jgi:hypothetical protein